MSKTVMVVDDSASVRQVVGLALRGAGYTVIEGVDGKDALSKLKGQKVHLIISDVNMPVMDGWEFLEIFTKEFSQFHEKVKVVILSSSVNPADLELAKNHPLVINFIPKPIGETELENLKKHESIAAFF